MRTTDTISAVGPETTVTPTIVPSGNGFHLSYTVNERARVTIKLFSLTGACIATIRDEELSPGPQQAEWNGCGKDGRQVPGGSYLAVCAIGGKVLTRKIVLVN
jgi:flagellar hook assembly protein FlgD